MLLREAIEDLQKGLIAHVHGDAHINPVFDVHVQLLTLCQGHQQLIQGDVLDRQGQEFLGDLGNRGSWQRRHLSQFGYGPNGVFDGWGDV